MDDLMETPSESSHILRRLSTFAYRTSAASPAVFTLIKDIVPEGIQVLSKAPDNAASLFFL